jgi:hypothetical protein
MNAANSQNLTLIIFSGWTYSAGHINAEMISKALFPPSPQNLVTVTFLRITTVYVPYRTYPKKIKIDEAQRRSKDMVQINKLKQG